MHACCARMCGDVDLCQPARVQCIFQMCKPRGRGAAPRRFASTIGDKILACSICRYFIASERGLDERGGVPKRKAIGAAAPQILRAVHIERIAFEKLQRHQSCTGITEGVFVHRMTGFQKNFTGTHGDRASVGVLAISAAHYEANARVRVGVPRMAFAWPIGANHGCQARS